MIDYYEGGNIGGVYGEGIDGFIIRQEDYAKYYRKGEWNQWVIAVTGNAPAICYRPVFCYRPAICYYFVCYYRHDICYHPVCCYRPVF